MKRNKAGKHNDVINKILSCIYTIAPLGISSVSSLLDRKQQLLSGFYLFDMP